MRAIQGTFLATLAAVGLSTAAFAADLPYKVPPRVVPATVFSWTGFYGGVYGGSSFNGNGATTITGDPTSANYNTLANNVGGVVGVPNNILPGGVNCAGFTNCPGGLAAVSITPNLNPGFRNDSPFPSQNSQQIRGLFGAEIGARVQFDRLVLGIGADFTWFTKDKGTNVTAQGTFFNSNGFTGYSQALGCIFGTATAPAGPCVTLQNLNTSGSVITVNSGGYAANLAIQSNPDWVGTVRGSVGFAIDRLLLTASGGLAYAPGALKVSGTYTDRTASACSGVANVYSASTNGGVPGESFVRYNCTGGAVAAFNSISQVVTTTVNYSGSRGGMLTGFAGGGGATYAVTDNVALSFEGMYYNLGTATATVTGAGTQTTTTTTIANSVPGGPPTTVTATAAVAGPTLVVSRVIDGYVFKGGVQLKF